MNRVYEGVLNVGWAIQQGLSVVELGESIPSILHMRPKKRQVKILGKSVTIDTETNEEFCRRLSETGEDDCHYARRLNRSELQMMGVALEPNG